jgi:hypothetical protein
LLTADFVGVARVSEVFLDSIGRSGCNSALVALHDFLNDLALLPLYPR